MKLTPVLSESDALLLVDATNHQAAWRNIFPDAADLIRDTWANGELPSSIQSSALKRDVPKGR